MDLIQKVQSEKYGGELNFSKNPIKYSKSQMADPTEPPLMGENTEEILRELLKYDNEKILDLKAKNII